MEPSRRGEGVAASANDDVTAGLQQEELWPDNFDHFDALFDQKMLDALGECNLLNSQVRGGNGTEAVHHQQQQHDAHKLSERNQTLTQACNWGVPCNGSTNGIGTPLVVPSPTTTLPASPASAQRVTAGAAEAQAAETRLKEHKTGGVCRSRRRGSAGAGEGGGEKASGKRSLSPHRMEIKASREKRRREEVNQEFDKLLQVLEKAEITSSLEPPASMMGKTQNGRRVEVLSHTIEVLKKLLEERRASLAATATGACEAEEEEKEEPVRRGLQNAAVQEGTSTLLVAGTAAATVAASSAAAGFDSHDADLGSVSSTGDAAKSNESSGPLEHDAPEQGAEAEAGAKAGVAAPPHHMAVPVSRHHVVMILSPGFASIPEQGMPPASQSMLNHRGHPIVFAVPMHMPQRQSMPTASAVENAGQVSATAASTPPAGAAPTGVAHLGPTVAATVAGKQKAVSAPLGYGAWDMPAGLGYQSMMTLQVPQFVTQALSAEADEKPTHALCA